MAQTWLAVIVGTLALCVSSSAATLYVAPDGDDADPGTVDRPLASLAGARDAVRRLDADEDVTVLFRGGIYRQSATTVFGLGDSAPEGQSVTYAAYPDEAPVLSSGMPVTEWRKLADPPGHLAQAARGNVWVADVSHIKALKESLGAPATRFEPNYTDWRFFSVCQGDRRLPRARGEGFNPTRSVSNARGPDQELLSFPPGAVRNWPDLDNAELVIVPMYFWIMNILPIESVDEAAGTASTAFPGTYSLGRNGMAERNSAWVENVLAALDEPGEWALDVEKALLYLWPEGDGAPADISVPLLTELVRVEGDIDYDGPADTPVKGLRFRGLTFTGGDRLPWHGNSGWGLQHDWEMFDAPTALVRFRGAEDCAVEECHFVNSAHTGVRLDLHCRGNRIVGNHIEHIGGAGVLLAGYGPGTKDVNRGNEISNNYIHDIGEVYWGSAGIFAWQSGENRITHNHIHGTPYTGIVVSGRIVWDRRGVGECSRTVRWTELESVLGKDFKQPDWYGRERFLHARNNLVARNDIHDSMRVMGDGNCIYVSGTGGGNRVVENYCHDCEGRHMNAVIRCDDDQHGTVIERNIMHRTRGFAEGVISKGDNDIIGNVIADLRDQERHRGYIVFPYGAPGGSQVQRNIVYSRREGQTTVGEGAARRGQPPALLRDTNADNNLYFCTEDPNWGTGHLTRERRFGIEGKSISADPLFADTDLADFTLKAGSPAVALGIEQPVSVDDVGLEAPYKERYVGRLIRTAISPRDQMLRKPVQLEMRSSDGVAEIHYTLDGSVPTLDSALYAGPFTIKEPATVRARSFADGCNDLVGAVAIFSQPPQPIVEDFESVAAGEMTPFATTSEETPERTARVSDEQAAGGKHSLKFTDGPGQKYAFNPHVYYRRTYDFGRMVGRVDLLVDENTSFYYQWRDYRGDFKRGPTVQIAPGGKLTHNERELMVIPTGEWVRFEVACSVGEDLTGTYEMKVFLPGGAEPTVFSDLACEEGFRQLDWVGFVPNGELATVVYVDNIEVRPARDD